MFVGIKGKNRLLATFFILATLLIIVGYFVMEIDEDNKHFSYFIFTTLSTVGFGDISPKNKLSRNLIATGMLCIIGGNFVGNWEGPFWEEK